MTLPSGLVSRVTGYDLQKGVFDRPARDLPQRIAILGEANQAKQGTFTEHKPTKYLSAADVGRDFGYGSPLYFMMRMLRPLQGDGVGPIDTIVFPQAEPSGASKAERNVTITGSASKNVTHAVVINGRELMDGSRYDFTVAKGDTNVEISQKIVDTINNALAAPCDAIQDTTVTADESALISSKWAGLTAEQLNIEIDTKGDSAGLTYSVSSETTGAGTPTIQGSLDNFGEEWNTIVIDPYDDAGGTIFDTLESFNGVPGVSNPSGRYDEALFKPFVALFGEKSSDGSTHNFSTRDDQVTMVECPAPNTNYFTYEIAASYARALSVQAHNEPHDDATGNKLYDLVAADSMGAYSDYTKRNDLASTGHSTVRKESGNLVINDLVTTYHPSGEDPPKFRWVRDLVIDWNMAFRYFIKEQRFVVDHTIAPNNQAVDAKKVIKPKDWNKIVRSLADEAARDGFIAEPDFMKSSISVAIGSNNPNRFETQFRYKRTGFARVVDSAAIAGFNFGSGAT